MKTMLQYIMAIVTLILAIIQPIWAVEIPRFFGIYVLQNGEYVEVPRYEMEKREYNCQKRLGCGTDCNVMLFIPSKNFILTDIAIFNKEGFLVHQDKEWSDFKLFKIPSEMISRFDGTIEQGVNVVTNITYSSGMLCSHEGLEKEQNPIEIRLKKARVGEEAYIYVPTQLIDTGFYLINYKKNGQGFYGYNPIRVTGVNGDVAYNQEAQDKLLFAIENSNRIILQEALVAGADANMKFKSPQFNNVPTPALLIAILKGNTDIVKLLIEHGADVNTFVKVEDGMVFSALLVARASGHQKIAELLSQAGASPRDSDEQTINTIQKRKRDRTMADIRALGYAVGSFQSDHHNFPIQEQEADWHSQLLPSEYYGGATNDAWGIPFRYWSDGNQYKWISYGSDRRAGGEGYAADIVYMNGKFIAPPDVVR